LSKQKKVRLPEINKISEPELIFLLQGKDEKAFNYLYDNYSGALYGLILNMVAKKDYADEIIQDVFVKVWKSCGQYDSTKGRLYTWMINIARNTALDFIKSKGFLNEQKNRSLSDVVNEVDSGSESVDELQNIQADQVAMKAVVYSLRKEWRELIELLYYQGYTQSEVAERLDIPIGTIKTRTRSALIELREKLKDYR
jgi:RNA polymerase sigma factor (sigma-70 family)